MSSLNQRHMKESIRRYQRMKRGQKGDTYINIGMFFCELALAEEFGFGKERLERLEKAVVELSRELIGGAERFSYDYRNNLEYSLSRIADRMDQIHGPGHCDWLRNIELE